MLKEIMCIHVMSVPGIEKTGIVFVLNELKFSVNALKWVVWVDKEHTGVSNSCIKS